jgi:hypothetical protein
MHSSRKQQECFERAEAAARDLEGKCRELMAEKPDNSADSS